MKNLLTYSSLCALFGGIAALCFCSLSTGCAAGGGLTPAAQTDVTNVETALNTVANVLQQANTGFQTAAPTLETILTLTHNQGDAAAVNDLAVQTKAVTPAITTLLNQVNTAIASATTPAAQQAAVNTALSQSSVGAIVNTVAAAAATPAVSSYVAPPSKSQQLETMNICLSSPGAAAAIGKE